MPFPAPLAPWLLWGGAALFLALQFFRGWRSGIVRQVAEVCAVGLGALAGYLVSPWCAGWLSPLGFPLVVLRALAGALIFALIYLAITLSTALLFKRTAQQPFAPLRLIFGLGGAVIALGLGLVLVAAVFTGLRLGGTLVRAPGGGVRANSPVWAAPVAELGGALDTSPLAPLLRRADPLPPAAYDEARQLNAVLASPAAMERLLAFPSVRSLANHPRIAALREDPTLLRAAEHSNYLELLRNPHLVRAANDPEIQRLVREVEWERALESALAPGGGPR